MIDPFVATRLQTIAKQSRCVVRIAIELKHQLEKQLNEMHESNKRKAACLEEEGVGSENIHSIKAI